MTPRPKPLLRAALVLIFGIGALAACSSDASTRTAAADTGPTTTAAPVSVPETVPAGTKLVVGDQLSYLETVLALSGEDQDLPYEVEYASFIGGPPMLQAFQAGAVDTGFVASTPLLFAQAAGQDLRAVVGWASEKGLGGLLTTDPSIGGWADLEGKKVAYQRGTSAEAAVLVGLASAGLALSDITTVDVPITQVNAALQSGSADAGLSTEPLISLFIADNPGARVAASPDGITDRGTFLIASTSTLDDDGKSAALADYAARLVRGFVWLNEHKGELAKAIFVDQYGLPADRADELVASGSGTFEFFSLPGEVLEPQQHLADLFHEAGQIPAAIDVEPSFDTRFNELVEKEAGA